MEIVTEIFNSTSVFQDLLCLSKFILEICDAVFDVQTVLLVPTVLVGGPTHSSEYGSFLFTELAWTLAARIYWNTEPNLHKESTKVEYTYLVLVTLMSY